MGGDGLALRPLGQGHGAGRSGTVGIQSEAAVGRGRAWARGSDGAQRWECGGQRRGSGDRDRAVWTEMWPRGQRWVYGNRDGAVGTGLWPWGKRQWWGERWQRWGCEHLGWDWSKGDIVMVKDGAVGSDGAPGSEMGQWLSDGAGGQELAVVSKWEVGVRSGWVKAQRWGQRQVGLKPGDPGGQGNEGRLRPGARDGLGKGRGGGVDQEWGSQSHLELPWTEGP